jgi:hypothetical protein
MGLARPIHASFWRVRAIFECAVALMNGTGEKKAAIARGFFTAAGAAAVFRR